MKTGDFSFELPGHLIAQYPPEQRGQSRLMVLNRLTGKRIHRMVHELPEILCGPEFSGRDGALPLLVFNNSKVRKARLIGIYSKTGSKVEFLLVEKTTVKGPFTSQSSTWKVLIRNVKRRKPGSRITFLDNNGERIANAEVIGRDETDHGLNLLAFDRDVDDAWIDCYGHVPLPPYIKRQDAPADADRYQTVYAKERGSTAAPTAGLHFTRELLDRIAAAGIETAFITLHVGMGTFVPVHSTNIEDHVMHRETFVIDEQAAGKIEAAKAQGRKIIAVGTTSVRTMESAWNGGKLPPEGRLKRGEGSTSIFIYPGYRFNVIDALFTNFHTPKSTLLMLAAAFAGRELILESYAEAIRESYRFFSYGDAMLIA